MLHHKIQEEGVAVEVEVVVEEEVLDHCLFRSLLFRELASKLQLRKSLP
jgi:hypothetical protein